MFLFILAALDFHGQLVNTSLYSVHSVQTINKRKYVTTKS